MTALEKYIDDLVNDKEPQDDFPKNESSWEELYDLCGRLIAEIVTLRRLAAQQSVQLTGGDSAPQQALSTSEHGSGLEADTTPPTSN